MGEKMESLKNKSVILTGAGSGIGRITARMLGELGANVFIVGTGIPAGLPVGNGIIFAFFITFILLITSNILGFLIDKRTWIISFLIFVTIFTLMFCKSTCQKVRQKIHKLLYLLSLL